MSSWLVRTSHANGLSVQTFCHLVYGAKLQVWNRDIDRLAPAWLIDELCFRTGTDPARAHQTTLRAYEGVIYPRYRSASVIFWILHLSMYHRQRRGYGLQFCPLCLAEDAEPYYRRHWRLGFYVVCHRHRVVMLDRCGSCQAPVAVHRLTMGAVNRRRIPPMIQCHCCGSDLRRSETRPFYSNDERISMEILQLGRWASALPNPLDPNFNLGDLRVLRHLLHLLTSRSKKIDLLGFALHQTNCNEAIDISGRVPIEQRAIDERLTLMYLVMWLWTDLHGHLRSALNQGAVRYNQLLKGIEDAPSWYIDICQGFSHWRER